MKNVRNTVMYNRSMQLLLSQPDLSLKQLCWQEIQRLYWPNLARKDIDALADIIYDDKQHKQQSIELMADDTINTFLNSDTIEKRVALCRPKEIENF